MWNKGLSRVWHYQLKSFKTRDTILERFFHKNQHTQRKLLNFENFFVFSNFFRSNLFFELKVEKIYINVFSIHFVGMTFAQVNVKQKIIHTDRNFVVEFDTWAKQFLDLTFCRHSNANSKYSGQNNWLIFFCARIKLNFS